MKKIRFHHTSVPKNRVIRITLGIIFILGGFFFWLPFLGIWMIPLGLLFLSIDFAIARRWRRRIQVWWAKRTSSKVNNKLDKDQNR